MNSLENKSIILILTKEKNLQMLLNSLDVQNAYDQKNFLFMRQCQQKKFNTSVEQLSLMKTGLMNHFRHLFTIALLFET